MHHAALLTHRTNMSAAKCVRLKSRLPRDSILLCAAVMYSKTNCACVRNAISYIKITRHQYTIYYMYNIHGDWRVVCLCAYSTERNKKKKKDSALFCQCISQLPMYFGFGSSFLSIWLLKSGSAQGIRHETHHPSIYPTNHPSIYLWIFFLFHCTFAERLFYMIPLRCDRHKSF